VKSRGFCLLAENPAFLGLPGERAFYRVKVQNAPGSGKRKQKGMSLRREAEYEGGWI